MDSVMWAQGYHIMLDNNATKATATVGSKMIMTAWGDLILLKGCIDTTRNEQFYTVRCSSTSVYTTRKTKRISKRITVILHGKNRQKMS